MIPLLTALAESLSTGLLWAKVKDAGKYRVQVLELLKELNNEKLKPEEDQSDLTLQRIERELLIINEAFKSFPITDSEKSG